MPILLVGVNHRTAPVEVRELFSFTIEGIQKGLEDLFSNYLFLEGLVLSTCNRSEVYVRARGNESALNKERLLNFFLEFHSLDKEKFSKYIYIYEGEHVVKHLFRVASGLDSMVIGESQILGQVKDAYSVALKNRKTKIIFNHLFQHAIEVGKRVRTETKIGSFVSSVSGAAVNLAKKIFGDLSRKVVLIIGAGETGEEIARSLLESGVKSFLVANRTYEKSVEVASIFGGKAIIFEKLIDEIVNVDIVIGSTSAPNTVVQYLDVVSIMKRRKGNPLFFIDIAVPRDIDPKVGELENVFLYNIDDLKSVVEENRKRQEKEIFLAERIVEEEVFKFNAWQKSREVVPTIRALRDKIEKVRREEIEKNLPKFKSLSSEDKERFLIFSESLLKKIFHEPTSRLMKKLNADNEIEIGASVRYLFDLPLEEKEEER